jgi:hypothetical protein
MKYAAAVPLLLCFQALARGFSPRSSRGGAGGAQQQRAHRRRPIRWVSGFEDPFVDATVLGDDKADLMATVGGGWPGQPVSASKRVAVNELLLRLEAGNPTRQPATSPLLNGVWDLAYDGGFAPGLVDPPWRRAALFLYAGGGSPTLLGLNLAQLVPDALLRVDKTGLTIKRDQPRVVASATVTLAGGPSAEVALVAILEAESELRLKETYVPPLDSWIVLSVVTKWSERLKVHA